MTENPQLHGCGKTSEEARVKDEDIVAGRIAVTAWLALTMYYMHDSPLT
jgi:hypothetical protein